MRIKRLDSPLIMVAMLLVFVALAKANVVDVENDSSELADDTPTYNILSIDGGGIRGVLPAGILLKMEKYAYEYAQSKGYQTKQYKDSKGNVVEGVVHLKDLFDMMAGTSTGSILAAGLAYPVPADKNKPKDQQRPLYYMQDLMDIYTKTGDRIFVAYDHHDIKNFFIILLFAAGCGAIGYYHSIYRFDNQEEEKEALVLQSLVGKKINLKDNANYSEVLDPNKDSANFSKTKQLGEKLISQVEGKLNDTDFIQAELELRKEQKEQKKNYKYYAQAFYIVVGIIVGIIATSIMSILGSAKYNRASLEQVMKEKLGAIKMSQAFTDELLITAYDYNSQEPRLYSKFLAEHEPKIYDVIIGDATGASSAAPTFFNPKVHMNGYQMTEILIDGGIICNNPTLYAYQLATVFHKKKKTRILSLGTGEKPFKKVTDKDSYDKTAFGIYKDEFMMNMDTYSADFYLQQQFYFQKRPEDYLRIQKTVQIPMDDISDSNIKVLKDTYEIMYKDNKSKIEKFVRNILDEKYGGKNKKKPKNLKSQQPLPYKLNKEL